MEVHVLYKENPHTDDYNLLQRLPSNYDLPNCFSLNPLLIFIYTQNDVWLGQLLGFPQGREFLALCFKHDTQAAKENHSKSWNVTAGSLHASGSLSPFPCYQLLHHISSFVSTDLLDTVRTQFQNLSAMRVTTLLFSNILMLKPQIPVAFPLLTLPEVQSHLFNTHFILCECSQLVSFCL